jgi:cell wall-associated NlpC family hydrolase
MIRGYIGIPFIDGGRDMTGCDCWGLIRLVYRLEAGIELPSYGEIAAADLLAVARSMRDDAFADPWRRVTDEPRRPMDVVLMRRLGDGGKAPVHVGIMVDPKRMLHIVEAADSHTVPLDHPTVKPRILDFFRHRNLS